MAIATTPGAPPDLTRSSRTPSHRSLMPMDSLPYRLSLREAARSALCRRRRSRVIFAKMSELAGDIVDLFAAGHERKDLDAGFLPAAKAGGDPPLDQNDKIIAGGHCVMCIVSDEDDAHALALGVVDKPEDGRRFL